MSFTFSCEVKVVAPETGISCFFNLTFLKQEAKHCEAAKCADI